MNEIGLPDGAVLKEPVSFEELYQRYSASWRVPPGQSLLCQKEVKSGIPAKPFYANDLNREQSERARKICATAGVSEPSALEDCILDVTVLGTASAANVFVHAPAPVLSGRHTGRTAKRLRVFVAGRALPKFGRAASSAWKGRFGGRCSNEVASRR